MEREQDKAGDNDLAETWRSAEQPRTDDLAEWLGHFFEQRRRLRTVDANSQRRHQNRAWDRREEMRAPLAGSAP
jgi:type IV secretory pathway TrbF-like protein